MGGRCRGGCSRCGWVVARGTGRRSRCGGRGRGCRGGGLGARCRLGRRRRCAPTRARRSVCRRGGSRRSLPRAGRPGLPGRGAPWRRRCRRSEGAGGPVEHTSVGTAAEVGVHEDAITGGVDTRGGSPARDLECRAAELASAARMVRMRSARSSQSAWLTARTATCSAPCRSASATAAAASASRVSTGVGCSCSQPSPRGSPGCRRRHRRAGWPARAVRGVALAAVLDQRRPRDRTVSCEALDFGDQAAGGDGLGLVGVADAPQLRTRRAR